MIKGPVIAGSVDLKLCSKLAKNIRESLFYCMKYILKFDRNFKTLPVYHNNCLRLPVYITKSKIVRVEDFLFRCFFRIVLTFFELHMCMYCRR